MRTPCWGVEFIRSERFGRPWEYFGPGEVVVLRSSFRPQPLIETLRRAGAAVNSSMQGTTHLTWFGRPAK
jgi:hypothetical protein